MNAVSTKVLLRFFFCLQSAPFARFIFTFVRSRHVFECMLCTLWTHTRGIKGNVTFYLACYARLQVQIMPYYMRLQVQNMAYYMRLRVQNMPYYMRLRVQNMQYYMRLQVQNMPYYMRLRVQNNGLGGKWADFWRKKKMAQHYFCTDCIHFPFGLFNVFLPIAIGYLLAGWQKLWGVFFFFFFGGGGQLLVY